MASNNIYLTPANTMYQDTSAGNINDQQCGVGPQAISPGILIKAPIHASAAVALETVKSDSTAYNKANNSNK